MYQILPKKEDLDGVYLIWDLLVFFMLFFTVLTQSLILKIMQIIGKIKIANKFVNGAIDKNSFEFENKGKFSTGRLSWSDKEKGKDGQEAWVSTYKKFIVFGDEARIIEDNLRAFFLIEGKIQTKSFLNQKGEKISFDQITLSKVELAPSAEKFNAREFVAKAQSAHDRAKSNAYMPDDDSMIPY